MKGPPVIHMLIWRRCHCNLRSPASAWPLPPPPKPRLDADAGGVIQSSTLSLLLLPPSYDLPPYIRVVARLQSRCYRTSSTIRLREGRKEGTYPFVPVYQLSTRFPSRQFSLVSSVLSFVAHGMEIIEEGVGGIDSTRKIALPPFESFEGASISILKFVSKNCII